LMRGDDHKFFIVPINAGYEYFEVLRKQIA
jgi:hypothetical protein